MYEVASVERKVGDLFGGDDLPQGRIRVSIATSVALTSTVEETDAGSKAEIHFAMFVDLQPDVLLLGRPESLGLHSNRDRTRLAAGGSGNIRDSLVFASREMPVPCDVIFTVAPATTAPAFVGHSA